MNDTEDDVIEIRVFLRKNRDEDKELYKMFEKLGKDLKPIRWGEIGKHVFQKAYEFWYVKEEKK